MILLISCITNRSCQSFVEELRRPNCSRRSRDFLQRFLLLMPIKINNSHSRIQAWNKPQQISLVNISHFLNQTKTATWNIQSSGGEGYWIYAPARSSSKRSLKTTVNRSTAHALTIRSFQKTCCSNLPIHTFSFDRSFLKKATRK